MRIEALDVRYRETAEELWSLQHAAYRVEAALIGSSDLPPLLETVEELQASRERFWGCRDADGELLGAIAAEREGGVAVVARMMVHPDYFRRGIAGSLLRTALAEFEPGAVWEVTAAVRNHPAVALYEKFGFRSEETFEPAPGIPMLRMRRAGTDGGASTS